MGRQTMGAGQVWAAGPEPVLRYSNCNHIPSWSWLANFKKSIRQSQLHCASPPGGGAP